jgi:hypothetical protein
MKCKASDVAALQVTFVLYEWTTSEMINDIFWVLTILTYPTKNSSNRSSSTVVPRYNAVRLALIRYYPAISFQPFLGTARFPPSVTLFASAGFQPLNA